MGTDKDAAFQTDYTDQSLHRRLMLTGGSSALRTLIEALRVAMPHATLVEGNRFGGVAAGLAWAGKVQGF